LLHESVLPLDCFETQALLICLGCEVVHIVGGFCDIVAESGATVLVGLWFCCELLTWLGVIEGVTSERESL